MATGWETQRQVYTGAATGTPIETLINCYTMNTPVTAVNPPPPTCATSTLVQRYPLAQVIKYKSLNGGPYSLTDIRFVSGMGLPTETDTYDFGATTPTQKTTVTYANLGNSIIDHPSSVKTTDGSNNLLSETDYIYDEDLNSLQPSGAVHLSPPPSGTPRGNLTTQKFYKTASSFLTKTYTHYDTGQVYRATDVNGAFTTFTYGDCGNSLLTNVQMPLNLTKTYADS